MKEKEIESQNKKVKGIYKAARLTAIFILPADVILLSTIGILHAKKPIEKVEERILGREYSLAQDANKYVSKYQKILVDSKNGGKIDYVIDMNYDNNTTNFSIVAKGCDSNKNEIIEFIEGNTTTPIGNIGLDSKKLLDSIKKGYAEYRIHSAQTKDKEIVDDETIIYHSYSTETNKNEGNIYVRDEAIVGFNPDPTAPVCHREIDYTIVSCDMHASIKDAHIEELKERARKNVYDNVVEKYALSSWSFRGAKIMPLSEISQETIEKYQDVLRAAGQNGKINNIKEMAYHSKTGKFSIVSTGVNEEKEKFINYSDGNIISENKINSAEQILEAMANGEVEYYSSVSVLEKDKYIIDDNTTVYHSISTKTDKESGAITIADKALIEDQGEYYTIGKIAFAANEDEVQNTVNLIKEKINKKITVIQMENE